MAEITLEQLMETLKQTNTSIQSLKSTIDTQAQQIEELKASKSTSANAAPDASAMTMSETERRLQAQLDKVQDANNKFYAEQRKERLYSSAKEGLKQRGISAKRVDLAFAAIKEKLSIDKAGTMKMIDATGADNFLDASLDQFADSEDGTFFKDPVDLKGAGSVPNQRQTSGSINKQSKNPSDKLSDKDFDATIMKALGL